MPHERQSDAASPNAPAGHAILHHHCSTGKTPLDSVLLTNLVLRYWFHDSGLVLRPVTAHILARLPQPKTPVTYSHRHVPT